MGESVKAESSVESGIVSLFEKPTSNSSENAKLSIPATAPSSGIYDPNEYLNEDVYGALVAFNQAWMDNSNGNHPQLGIVFIDSLNGNSIEEVANETARSWKIGSSKDNLGILLLVAVEDRGWRVEVSDKLGGVLTDSQAYGLGDSMKSDFRYEDYSKGVITFINGLNKTLAEGYGEPIVDLGYGDEEVGVPSAAQVLFSMAFLITCAVCVLVVMYRGIYHQASQSYGFDEAPFPESSDSHRVKSGYYAPNSNYGTSNSSPSSSTTPIYYEDTSRWYDDDSYSSSSSSWDTSSWGGGDFGGGGASGGW